MDASSEGSNGLRQVFDAMAECVIRFDADGRIVDCNRAARRLLRLDVEADRLADVDLHDRLFNRDGTPLPADRAPALRALRGEMVRDVELLFRTGTGRTVSVLASADPLTDGTTVTGAVVTCHDVTLQDRALAEVHESAARNAALARIGAIVGSTLDVDEILRDAVRESCEAVGAESAVIVMRENGVWVTRYSYRFPDEIIGVILTDEDAPHAALALQTAEPVAIDDAYVDPLVNGEVMRAYGLRSVLTMPITRKGAVVGVMFLNHHSAPVAFTPWQIDFVAHAASTISLALRNAELYSEQRSVADTLQQAMLTTPKHLPGVDFSCLYRSATGTARVGGDFYAIFALPGDRIGLAIGDVSGKGLAAAATAAMIKDTVHAYAAAGDPPAAVLRKTNELMHVTLDSASFVSMLFGVIDPAARTFTYSSGGHPPAILLSERGAMMLSTGGTVVGPFPGAQYLEETQPIAPGETLLFYTDGVTEARRAGELYGDTRLVDGLKALPTACGLERLVESVFFDVLDYTGGPLGDDLALLAVRLAPVS